MDIAGAKALKERLGHRGRAAGPETSADVSDDAPPVYHYLGVSDSAPEAPPDDPGRFRSLLRRLGLAAG